MNRIRRAVQARRERSEEYRNSIHFAIAHARSESERNELMEMAVHQGVQL